MTEGDLHHAYVMFDHIKRIHNWMTLGAHVYDPFCHRLLTIAVCKMKTETEDSQQRFWHELNAIVEEFGGFVARFTGNDRMTRRRIAIHGL
jgi:hypothetical protein